MFATSFYAAAIVFTTAVVAAPGSVIDARDQSYDSSVSTAINAPQLNECNNIGGQVCCNSLDFDQGAISESLLSVIDVPIDANLLVGHGCSPLIGLQATCNAQAACCEKTYSGIGVNCNNLAF